MRRASIVAWVAAALLASACAEPPNKEMGEAQGAIDAARAIGAETFAATEYSAAVSELKQSNDAVSQGDYRLALNHALESREHATSAARIAAAERARVQGEVERSMAEVASLLAQANTLIAAAERGRVNRRVVQAAQRQLAQVNEDVQKAGAAMKADDYAGAQPALKGVKERIEKIIASLGPAPGSQGAKRSR